MDWPDRDGPGPAVRALPGWHVRCHAPAPGTVRSDHAVPADAGAHDRAVRDDVERGPRRPGAGRLPGAGLHPAAHGSLYRRDAVVLPRPQARRPGLRLLHLTAVPAG